VSRQQYNVARLEGGEQMQKTARPHARSAARSNTMNMKYKIIFKQYRICMFEVVGLAAVECVAYGGN